MFALQTSERPQGTYTTYLVTQRSDLRRVSDKYSQSQSVELRCTLTGLLRMCAKLHEMSLVLSPE